MHSEKRTRAGASSSRHTNAGPARITSSRYEHDPPSRKPSSLHTTARPAEATKAHQQPRESAAPRTVRPRDDDAESSRPAKKRRTQSVEPNQRREAKPDELRERQFKANEPRKRKRDEEVADIPKVIRCRFDSENSKIFHSTEFSRVEKSTRADRHTLALYEDKWKHIPAGWTPVPATDEDLRRYKSDMQRFSLLEVPGQSERDAAFV
ncbi:hypothetical protein B0H15DRAFT_806255 [Mycena belliarum]|uniref:Uncharacterized protein n=1 Tax=Mycena belliarum TaxID=1033014 RepID=A0AAD6TP51_9AGAR|nr:hypothetical protein B0H15DRAFT_806255 [Mycena belliae]